MSRTDKQGFSTKVTAFPDGYGCRVLLDGTVVSEAKAKTKLDVGPVLKELLRWVSKMGHFSGMAEASRSRKK